MLLFRNSAKPQFDLKSREITPQVDVTHAKKTSVDSLKVFEDQELLKGRHILVENCKAILYPSPQDASLKTPLPGQSSYNRNKQE